MGPGGTGLSEEPGALGGDSAPADTGFQSPVNPKKSPHHPEPQFPMRRMKIVTPAAHRVGGKIPRVNLNQRNEQWRATATGSPSPEDSCASCPNDFARLSVVVQGGDAHGADRLDPELQLIYSCRCTTQTPSRLVVLGAISVNPAGRGGDRRPRTRGWAGGKHEPGSGPHEALLCGRLPWASGQDAPAPHPEPK